jgi:hypothetical protein
MKIDFELIKRLVKERDELIKSHPKGQEIQDAITERMKKAGNQHNRMVILSQMMKERLRELVKTWGKLLDEVGKQ